MIFPWLDGIKGLRYCPLTWVIVILNVVLHLSLSLSGTSAEKKMDEIMQQKDFRVTLGLSFAQFSQRNPAQYSPLVLSASEKAQKGYSSAQGFLASYALRDINFLNSLSDYNFHGDRIALAEWKEKMKEVAALREVQATSLWGISSFSSQIWRWLTYQFVHGSMAHLIFNLFFLLIFGAWVESRVNSLLFSGVYLFGGVCAALSFCLATGATQAHLVGASGAVNALVGFFAVHNFGKTEKFLFFVLPTTRHSGLISLPTWVFLITWVGFDLASWLALPSEMTSVAHSAHLGGFLFGALSAYLWTLWSKTASHRVL